jgi:hypothetical protein
VSPIYGRADSGFYCRDAVEAYEDCNVRFAISARKTVSTRAQPQLYVKETTA